MEEICEGWSDLNYLLFSGIYAYVTLKEHATITPEDLRLQLKKLVKKEIGSFAAPEIIQVFLYLN